MALNVLARVARSDGILGANGTTVAVGRGVLWKCFELHDTGNRMARRVPLQRILLPLDFSEYASEAAHYACSLADAFHAELHLLHVLEIRASATPVFGGGLSLTAVTKESRAAAEQTLKSNLDPDWAPPVEVKYATADGSPFVEIVKYAKENNIDMIVMSTHGRSGVAHMLLGSVAENVIRSAPCPVLAVQSKRHKFVRL